MRNYCLNRQPKLPLLSADGVPPPSASFVLFSAAPPPAAALAAATAGDKDMPAIASSRDELRAVLKMAGIRAKPGQVEQAWSALRSGEALRASDLKKTPAGYSSGSGSASRSASGSGSCSGSSSSSSGGGKGRLAVKLALAEMFLEPTSLSFSMLAAAAAMGVVAVVVVVTAAASAAAAVVVVVVFCCKTVGRRVRRLEDVRRANGANGVARIHGGKGRAERYQMGFDGSDGVIRPGGLRSGEYRR